MSRLLDLPASLHITEVPIPIHGAIEPTAAPGAAEVIPKAKVLLSLPPRDAVHPHTNTPAASKPEPADIMVLRIEKSGGVADDAGEVGVDMSSPVQKILAALQGLRGQVATGLRDQIDAIMREVCQYSKAGSYSCGRGGPGPGGPGMGNGQWAMGNGRSSHLISSHGVSSRACS
jgi:hypothetical protein